MTHTPEQIIEKGRELASLVISANEICNRSKLDELELQRLNVMVEAARGILTKDTGEYNKAEDEDFFG